MKTDYLKKVKKLSEQIDAVRDSMTDNDVREDAKYRKIQKLDDKILRIFMPKINYRLRKNDFSSIQKLIDQMPSTVNRMDLCSKLRNIKNERLK